MANTQTLHKESIGLKVVIYIVCIILAILSLMPFFIMFMNATRSTAEIQSSAIALYSEHPILNLTRNWKVFNGKSFDPATGFINSLIVSTCTTILAVYFSCLTSYALFAYEWKLRDAFHLPVRLWRFLQGDDQEGHLQSAQLMDSGWCEP